jgi:hypothetical protein
MLNLSNNAPEDSPFLSEDFYVVRGFQGSEPVIMRSPETLVMGFINI